MMTHREIVLSSIELAYVVAATKTMTHYLSKSPEEFNTGLKVMATLVQGMTEEQWNHIAEWVKFNGVSVSAVIASQAFTTQEGNPN